MSRCLWALSGRERAIAPRRVSASSRGGRENVRDSLLLGNDSQSGLGDAWIRDTLGDQDRAGAWGTSGH